MRFVALFGHTPSFAFADGRLLWKASGLAKHLTTISSFADPKTRNETTVSAAAVTVPVTKPPAQAPDANEEARWRPVMLLPCQLTLDLTVPSFRVADFLALRVGSVIGSEWGVGRDLPLRVNGILIGWAELEGSGAKLAVRLTEIA